MPDVTPAAIVDRSGFDFNGRVRGLAELVSGKVGQALELDGVDDFVEVLDPGVGEIGTGDFTLETWVRPASTGELPIVEKVNGSGRGYAFSLTNGTPELYLGTSGGATEVAGSASLPADGAWHHVAVVVKRGLSGGGAFFIDGEPAGVFDTTGLTSDANAGAPLFIGRSVRDGESLFLGAIDGAHVDAFGADRERGGVDLPRGPRR